MNKDQLASVVAAEVGLSQTDAKSAVEAVFDGITNGMKMATKLALPVSDSLNQDTGLQDKGEILRQVKQSK